MITFETVSIKMNKEQYEKSIKEDLVFLNKHCPDGVELRNSINWHYPKRHKIMCINDNTKECDLCHECDIESDAYYNQFMR